MKIALLGAPGAGKSKIARRTVARLNKADGQRNWVVIDDYVPRLRKRTGLHFGIESSMQEHIQIIAERWTLEQEAEAKGLNSITCGSLYESIIYASIPNAIPANEDDLIEHQTFYRTIMPALGALEGYTFDYTALFHLPWLNPSPEMAHSWEGVVDAKLLEVLSAYFKYATPLDGTDRQKVDRATEIISLISEALASNDEPSV